MKSRLKKDGSIFFIDATSSYVCHPVRARQNQVFSEQASFGYSTLHGQFFGFKLHLILNHNGEIANYAIFRFRTGLPRRYAPRNDDVAGYARVLMLGLMALQCSI